MKTFDDIEVRRPALAKSYLGLIKAGARQASCRLLLSADH